MCTVTYIPAKDHVLFSSSRDENPRRKPASPPRVRDGQYYQLFYPSDGLAGGSWIGMNSAGDLLIILNGGCTNHSRKTAYRKSRGLILTSLLDSPQMIDAWYEIDLENIEPFTLVAYINATLHQFVWSGTEKTHLQPDASVPHIWSSSTLYNTAAKDQRRKWFNEFILQTPHPSPGELLQYLVTDAPIDHYNGFNMNRDELIKTCSVSVVELQKYRAEFLYHDALLGETVTNGFFFEEKSVVAE